jgi:hypothetical protein
MELAAAEAAGNEPRTLRAIARKHIKAASEGDIRAMEALADRLDGKPAQATAEEWEKEYGTSETPTKLQELN